MKIPTSHSTMIPVCIKNNRRRKIFAMISTFGIFVFVVVFNSPVGTSFRKMLPPIRLFVLFNSDPSYSYRILEPLLTSGIKPLSNRSNAVHNCFMAVTCIGGLGNQMFEYSALLGIAAERECIPVTLKCEDLDKYFHVTRTTGKYQIEFKSKHHHEKYNSVFDPSFRRLATNQNWTLEGNFACWEYFMHIQDTIRKEFTFRDNILVEAKQILSQISTNGVLIGVHVRRGDFLEVDSVQVGRTVANVTYMTNAMDYYRKKFTNVTFIVCSARDDIAWCKENLVADDVRVAPNAKRGVHMALLSLCSHSIITVGSFGWWSAFLTGGEAVYMKEFPRPGSWLSRSFKESDRYLPQWIAISSDSQNLS